MLALGPQDNASVSASPKASSPRTASALLGVGVGSRDQQVAYLLSGRDVVIEEIEEGEAGATGKTSSLSFMASRWPFFFLATAASSAYPNTTTVRRNLDILLDEMKMVVPVEGRRMGRRPDD